MLIERDRDHSGARIADEGVALLVVGELQQLLAEVVSERIGHQLHNMGCSLIEDDLQGLRVVLFKLLLQEPTTMLVLAESVDLMTRHSLQIIVHEAVGIVLETTGLNNASLAVLNASTRSVCGIRVVVWNIGPTEHAVCTISSGPTHLRTRSHRKAVHAASEHRHAVEVWGVRSRRISVLRQLWRSNSASDAID
jgi:hypothetical protein